jgi:hypothetical protein
VDVYGTPLKLAGLLDGAVVYTKDGFLPTKKEDGSLFVVSRISNTFVTPDKQAGFAKEKLQMIEKGEKIDIISEKEVMIDGLCGIEIVGYTAGGSKKLIYQTMLFDGKNSHVMVGIARSSIRKTSICSKYGGNVQNSEIRLNRLKGIDADEKKTSGSQRFF